MSKRCLISLIELSDENTMQDEYCTAGVKSLTGSVKVTMRLPFTRANFVQELPAKQKGMSISGYQPKLSLTVNENNEFAVAEQQGSYILKPSPEQFPFLAEVEHASMMVMKQFGLEVPAFGLLRFKVDQNGHEERTFIIQRYDRLGGDEKVHQEQLDSAMGVDDKYGKDATSGTRVISYERVGQYLAENVNGSFAAKRDFYQRIILSYLIGNNDLHLRNFGLLLPKEDSPRLAPVYDVVSVAPYKEVFDSCYLALPLLIKEEGEGDLADGFSTAYGEYIGADFIEFGIGIGLNKRAAKQILENVLSYVSDMEDTYKKSFVPAEPLKAILDCIKYRAKTLGVFKAEII